MLNDLWTPVKGFLVVRCSNGESEDTLVTIGNEAESDTDQAWPYPIVGTL